MEPGAASQSDFAPCIALSNATCLAHTLNIAPIAAAARQQGLDVDQRSANQIWASRFGPQGVVNMESDYTYECAVTAVVSQRLTDAQARTAFLAALT